MTHGHSDAPRFRGFRSPNYTQVPDELFDELLPDLSGAELKVLLYIIRRTFGFKRDSDSISLSQITSGIETRDGEVLDRGTGLSKASVATAVKSLEARGVIVRTRRRSDQKGDEPTTYSLNVVPVSKNQTPPGIKIGHPPVQELDTQETVNQETDFDHSNLRKASHDSVDKSAEPADVPVPASRPRGGNVEAIGAVLERRRGRPRRSPTFDEDREVLLAFVQDFSREFNDRAPLGSSVTRAHNLLRASGLPRETFLDRLYQARAITKERSANVRSRAGTDAVGLPTKNKMAYFFAVLEDLLGLRDGDGDQGRGVAPRNAPG